MKRCTKCGRELPLSEFYYKKGKPTARCKDCLREETRNNYRHKKTHTIVKRGKCSKCIYHTNIGEGMHEVACYYIRFTGQRRGCSVDECDKYVEGEQLTMDKEIRQELLRFK